MLNRIIVIGRLVKDPELRKAKENSVASFTIAVDGYKDTTSFFNCTAWNKTAENLAKYAKKGLLVGLDGRLEQHTYERKDGSKGSAVQIVAESVEFLEPKKAAEETIDPNEEIAKQEIAEAKSGATHYIKGADEDPGLPF